MKIYKMRLHAYKTDVAKGVYCFSNNVYCSKSSSAKISCSDVAQNDQAEFVSAQAVGRKFWRWKVPVQQAAER